MPYLGTKADNEKNSFVEVTDSGPQVAQRVKPVGAGGNLLEGITFDYIAFAYPDSVTEVFTYKSGGSGGTTVATITAVYTTSTKDYLLSVART